jgi:2-methylcitrate dehydratase PrpD
VRAVHDRVTLQLDVEVDAAYPARWIGKVTVDTLDGRRLRATVLEPKGDPGNTLSRQELEEKAVQLALYRGGATKQEMTGAIERIWTLPQLTRVAHLIA